MKVRYEALSRFGMTRPLPLRTEQIGSENHNDVLIDERMSLEQILTAILTYNPKK